MALLVHMSEREAVRYFKFMMKEGTRPADYYCGITNDLEERANWHNAKFICFVEADSVDTANALEIALDAAGFYCGAVQGNAHEEDSRFVYMYLITPETRETNND